MKMKLLLVSVMLTTCAATTQDLSGKVFTFPMEGKKAHVRLNLSQEDLHAATVCFRSLTDLKRSHSLISIATPSHENAVLVFWDGTQKEMEFIVKNLEARFGGVDYKLNTWHSVCTTWDSESGLVQLWFDGKPSIRKFLSSEENLRGPFIIVLGQEQDEHGGGFDINQSFLGMLSDVHMWDYALSYCEIQNYMDMINFTPGNVLNWRALDYEIIDKVMIENKVTVCY